MMSGRAMFFCGLLFASASATGQSDSLRVLSDSLQQVSVHGTRKNPNAAPVQTLDIGAKSYLLDTSLRSLNLSLARTLEESAPVFIRSYGFNALALASVRGASAAQTSVLWNGIPMQNAALGTSDLSQIPSAFQGSATLLMGSNAALAGSGTVGGAILLDDAAPVFQKNFSGRAALTAGSFGMTQGLLQLSRSSSGGAGYITMQGNRSDNNFRYRNALGAIERMDNAAQSGFQGVAGLDLPLGKGGISLKGWYHRQYRQTPPALFESNSEKDQEDEALRLGLILRQPLSSNLRGTWRVSYIRDRLSYEDVAIQLGTQSDATRWGLQQEYTWQRQRHQILLMIPTYISTLHTKKLRADSLRQSELAVALAYRYAGPRLGVTANVRAESIGSWKAVLPGFGVQYQPCSLLRLRLNTQRTFRAPTLNELYFFPGGNINLKPEQGWSFMAGADVQTDWRSLQLSASADAFARYIHDWIIWFGGAVFTPHNIAAVFSRGIELEGRAAYPLGKGMIKASGFCTFLKSTTEESHIPNDGSIGRQIPYVPRLLWRGQVDYKTGGLQMAYRHVRNGYRFITTDESAYLLPYQTGSLTASYTLGIKRLVYGVSLSVENLWNEQYQSVVARPMPGRYWMLGLSVEWN